MVVRSRGPCYEISELFKDCSIPGKVYLRNNARQDAKPLGFETQSRVLDFVSSGELRCLEYEGTRVLEKGPDAGVLVDAYIFMIGPKYVYFAFYKKNNGNWIIKSFHPPEFGDNLPLTHAPFKKLGGL